MKNKILTPKTTFILRTLFLSLIFALKTYAEVGSGTSAAGTLIAYSVGSGLSPIGTLASMSISLNAPIGGENWVAGTSQNITWVSSNVTNVKLEYTTNNGTNWATIIASTPASTGSYAWTVPNTPSTNCKVKISDVSNSSINGLSDSAFTILDNKIPNIVVSTNLLSFGNVYRDSTDQKQITITNTGTADLQIQSTSFYQTSSAYKVAAFNQTINPDTARKVTVSFTPKLKTSYPDTLYIYHNAAGSPAKIALTGTGIEVPKPIIKIAATTVLFDTTFIDANNQKTIAIVNEGNAELSITNISADRSVFTPLETAFIVGAGLQHLLTLKFSPTSDSGYSGTLSITHNAAGSPTLISLTGKGKRHVPNIVLSSKEINFGVIKINTHIDASLIINNTGTADLNVTNISSSNTRFVTNKTNFVVPQGSSETVTLTFTPIDAVQYTGTLTINHDAANGSTTVAMAGAGYPEEVAVSRTISFGDITLSGNYRMVGLPGNSNIQVAATVTGAQKTDWNAFYDNGSLSAVQTDYLKEYDGSAAFTFKPGNGFWVVSKNGLTVSAHVLPVPLSADSTYSIPLQANWNIISNPFEKSTSWTKIKDLNGLGNDPLYKWNGHDYLPPASEMTTYEGFYFLNEKGLTVLKIPYDATGTMKKFFKLNEAFILGDKGFSINCNENGVEKTSIFAGFNSKASNDVDDYDYFMPPADFGEVSLVLNNDSLSSAYKKLIVEQRKRLVKGSSLISPRRIMVSLRSNLL